MRSEQIGVLRVIGPKGGRNIKEEVDSSPEFSLVREVILGFLSLVQVAVKIIDKTQLNSSSLQKVSTQYLLSLSKPLSGVNDLLTPFGPPLEPLIQNLWPFHCSHHPFPWLCYL